MLIVALYDCTAKENAVNHITQQFVLSLSTEEISSMAQQLRRRALEVCRRMGAPDPEAEDVAQDVMLKLWEMRGDVGRFRSVEMLVGIMARNMLISKWRTDKHRSRGLWHTDSELALAIDSAADPQEAIEQQEMARWLERRLSELPTTQHTILYLRQVEHRSNAEIARLLGIEETSVSTLLSRARRALLASLSPSQALPDLPWGRRKKNKYQ